jgi:hypothetical protein
MKKPEKVKHPEHRKQKDWTDYDPDKPPKGCAACGGPFPLCAESCPIFDR